jgi:hypothetical protein
MCMCVCCQQVFTTVHAGQLEVCFLVFQGEAPLASSNQLLGQFQLGPLPPAPAGSLRIQVLRGCTWAWLHMGPGSRALGKRQGVALSLLFLSYHSLNAAGHAPAAMCSP